MKMDFNQEYFTSYEDLEIHRLMLEDDSRTETYRKAIHDNKAYFNNKIVLDVGCGTGILSLFCAQAGAKKVYAVDASNIADVAREVVIENDFEDLIEVIQSNVEDLVLPNEDKVDVIVSEWMGFYLLHEGMLDSVLIARDKFLKADGQMFPETATIYVAPCSVPSLYRKWNNFHGVSMSTFANFLRTKKRNQPEIMLVEPDDLLGSEISLCSIKLKEAKISDLSSFSIQHVLGASKPGKYQGMCVWFDCSFPKLSEDCEKIVLSTSPQSPGTHWKQTVILLPEEQDVEEGEPLAFQLSISKDKSHNRRYNLQVTLMDSDSIEHPVPCSCDMTKCILINAVMRQYTETTADQMTNTENCILEDEEISDN